MAPIIIPIFLPNAGCRERCLFCNQKAMGEELPSPSSVRTFIESSLIKLPTDGKKREKQVAFYGGSFTAIGKEDQIGYLNEVQSFLASGLIDSIRISTRPDALDEERLYRLRAYGVKTVEIGAQSMIDHILFLANRGHCAEDTLSAASQLRRWKFEVGIHLMMGLPGDSLDHFLKTLDHIIPLKPDFVRIHPTLVLKGAPLENLWREGEYSPLSLDEAIQWLKPGLLKLERASIPVARVGLQPTRDLEKNCLAGPYHPALHQLVDSAIFFDMAQHLIQTASNGPQVFFHCHPGEISSLRGQKNQNILKLKGRFRLRDIRIQENKGLPRGCLVIQTQGKEISIDRKSLDFNLEQGCGSCLLTCANKPDRS